MPLPHRRRRLRTAAGRSSSSSSSFALVEKCSHQFSLLTTADTAASATVLHVFDNRNFSSVAARPCVGRRYKTQSPAVRSSTIQSVSVHQYFTVTIIFNSVNTELVVHDSVLRRATYGDLQRRNVTTHSLLYAPKNRVLCKVLCIYLLEDFFMVSARMMAPKIQEDDNIVNNNNKGDSPKFKLNIVDTTTVHRGGNTDSNSTNNSQFSSMSEEESYECYGEADMETSSSINNVLTNGVENSNANALGLKRNTWLRTSLRRTTNGNSAEILPNRKWGSMRHSSGKRISSNALASELYRSSSFNSSGRSSVCDTPDDVFSDTSIEEDVIDLNNKVQVLQKQMNALADNQHLTDERYARTKEENAALQARVHMLEEQLRDTELRCEERLASEERRHRELVTRVDREKQLHIDNCAIRLQSIESANESLRLEAEKCKSALETARNEKVLLEQRVNDLNMSAQSFKEEIHMMETELRKLKQREKDNEEIIKGLTRELEVSRMEKEAMVTELHSPSPYVTELTTQLESLKHQNRSLKDSYDELQASTIAKGIEQGRLLLTESPSLASELDGLTHADHSPSSLQLNKMKTALKDQQEVNDQLRTYIDNILLNIVENHPELLEVKQNL